MAEAGTSSPTAGERVAVLLPLPLAGAYDYRLPPGMCAPAGSFVSVPLGRREAIGVVWGPGEGEVPEARLKTVHAVIAAPPMGAALRRLIDWVAAYTLAPRGAVLRMALSVPEALFAPAERIAYARGTGLPERLTPARARVLAEAEAGRPRPVGELALAAGVSPSVVRGLAEGGHLVPVALAAETPLPAPDLARPGPRFSADQRRAAEALAAKVRARRFDATLLDGVNGAGKTEVYFHAIAAALAEGRQALVLLPEIALGAQWLERFRGRFGVAPSPWHSELTRAQRRRLWRAVAAGQAPVVVGARSSLFLPFPDLGLIVVDEEHDASYKQEEGVIYHARDIAVVRARLEQVPIVLVSATPSLETVVNVRAGRYDSLHLPDRHGQASLPKIEAVDMRRVTLAAGRWLSPRLVSALAATFEAGEQAMLFLNRRGYAPLTLCRACGHRLGCPQCSTWLVEHRHLGRLQCHHCGHAEALPEACPKCGVAGKLAAVGPGVERLAEEVALAFPTARLALMASDTLSGPKAAEALVQRMAAREIDLLIGTQVIAKGHHFPFLTLVGVVDADLGLGGGDLRAAERTYQLLHQVAGRAGRAAYPGTVILQTYMPEHPVMRALIEGDRDGFLEAEIAARRERSLPPFGRLAALIVSGPNEAEVQATARALARAGPRAAGVETLGPVPAPLALLRGRYRYRLLLKAQREIAVQPLLRAWLAAVRPGRGVRIQVDVDPYSFL